MSVPNNQQLGYFLDYALWEDALKLLKFQISQKHSNRHFSTLSMHYYELVERNSPTALASPEYFNERIANNLFYGLEEEFKAIQYLVPKPGLGLRHYHFFSYPMRVLYYMIGLYLVKLSQGFRDDIKGRYKHITSFWGGHLRFENGHLCKLTKDSVYYRNYYKSFKRQLLGEASESTENRVVLKLDVQNYFEEVQHSLLIKRLSENCAESEKSQLRFDDFTKTLLLEILSHFSGSTKGIPQLDNDILSSFIGYLYLVFGDLHIDDEVKKYKGLLHRYRIYRYIDDIYIVLDFLDGVEPKQKEKAVSIIASCIADSLYAALGLRLNQKCELFWLNIEKDKTKFIKSLKKVSREDHLDDPDDENVSAEERLSEIFEQLSKLKRARLDGLISYDQQPEEDIFKAVMDRDVSHLLKAQEVQDRILVAFEQFDFELVNVSPLALTILITSNQVTKQNYRNYLFSLPVITTREIHKIVRFLCQIGFDDTELLHKLLVEQPWPAIIKMIEKPLIRSHDPGYFQLSHSLIKDFVSCSFSTIEQIRLRISSERQNKHSVALNHLINEFQAICWHHNKAPSKPALDKFNADKVQEYLHEIGIGSTTVSRIRTIFDRRNNNQISHVTISSAVSEAEYLEFRRLIGKCIENVTSLPSKG